MGMQLNIKSDEAYQLAAKLAELTGESLTTAVTEALRQRVDAEEKTRSIEIRKQEIRDIAAAIRADLREAGQPLSSLDHDWLYDDETGLPI
jgi:antitoxin VapB